MCNVTSGFQYFLNKIEETYNEYCINFSGLKTKKLPIYDLTYFKN